MRYLGSGRIPGEKVLGHCWPALSGSTRSQSPPSVRRISSGFRHGSLSGRMRKRSKVSAKITFISVMANVCPMQFLQAGVVALTTPWTFIPASPSRKSGPQPPPPSAETEKPNNVWDPQHGFAHPLGLVQIPVVNADAGGKGLSAHCRPLLGPTSIPKTLICHLQGRGGKESQNSDHLHFSHLPAWQSCLESQSQMLPPPPPIGQSQMPNALTWDPLRRE